jgi:DNA-binding response OmpR family regulator
MVHVIETGDFHIDLKARRARVRDRELDLSPEEFDLLVYLAGHPNSVITPHTTLSTRSGAHGVRRAGVLHVLLNLQKRIDGGSETGHYIRTEPWIAYRFTPGHLQGQ